MAIAPPSWCKNAEPTPRGWVVKGELVKAMRISQEDIDIWHGNVPAQAPKPDPMMHTHDDGMTHSHDGGDMPHNHAEEDIDSLPSDVEPVTDAPMPSPADHQDPENKA